MENHEVTKWLMVMKASLNSFPEVSKAKKIEALREAIRFLKNEEPEISTSSDDCISRKAAEDITWQGPSYTDPLNILTEVRDKIRELPSVTPIRPKGHWIEVAKYSDGKHEIECSKCGSHIFDRGHANSYIVKEKYKYCPRCGADMRGSEE